MELRDYQQRAIDAIKALIRKGKRRIVVVSMTGCHEPDQGILLWDGANKKAKDIASGDVLLGPDGPRTVIETFSGYGPMFRVSPVKGAPWIVSGSHVLPLVRSGEHDSWPEEESPTVRQWLAWPKSKKRQYKLQRSAASFAPSAHFLPIDPYVLGILLGDGSLQHCVGVTSMDPEVIEVFSKYAEGLGLTIRAERAGGPSNTYYAVGKKKKKNPIAEALGKLGLRSECGHKFVPHIYKSSCLEDRLQVIAGIVDTDGHLACGGYDFISKSRQLSEDLTFLCRSVGLAAYVKECVKTCTNNGVSGTYYRVSISGDCSIIPCRVPRRVSAPRKQKKSVLRTGFRVDPVGNGKHFGFSVSGDKLYLMDDFTVTHNSGKTHVFTHGVVAPAVAKGSRCLVLVHRKELLDQTLSKLSTCNVQASVIRASDPRFDADSLVQVATIETLVARNMWPAADIIIADECHHFSAGNTWSAFRGHYPKAVILGFTATPATSTGQTLDGFDAIVVASTYRQLIAEGHLVPCEVFVPQGVSERLRGKIAMDPAEAFDRYANGRPGLVFLSSVAECDACNEKLLELGYRSSSVVGERPAERDAGISEFRNGNLDVLCSVSCLTEGFDAPRAKVAVSGRGLGSVSTMIQLVGRVLRPDGFSRLATWVDLSGASIEHGHPCDDREYSIEPGEAAIRPRSTLPALWQCKSCWWVDKIRPSSGVCPFCGDAIPPAPTLKLARRAFAKMVAWECPDCHMEHYHTPLNCSRCGATTPRLARALTDSPDARVSYLRRQLDQARLAGWNPWSARYRFKGKYGQLPTAEEWRLAFEGQPNASRHS